MADPRRKTAAAGGQAVPLQRSTRLEQWRARRQKERRYREIAEALRRKPFRLYGLPAAWEGRRALSGTSYGKRTGLRGVRFSHEIGEGRKPVTVYVSTSRLDGSSTSGAKEEVEYDFELRTGPDEPPGRLEWRRMQIPVDGISTNFEVIAGQSGQWGAVGAVGDVVVSVEVVNFAMADVVLETVQDVEPYLEGSRSR